MASTDLSKLSKKTLDLPRGVTYTYYTSPAKDGTPTILLLHGFPDSAAEWAGLINDHLLPECYGMIAPDLLGYAGTSKPTDPAEYAFHLMTADVAAILDKETLQQVVVLAHDWGCSLLCRFYNHYPNRVSGLVLCNVAYNPPNGQPFDLQAMLDLTKSLFGYSTMHYWSLFTAPDGAEILNSNLESIYSSAHADPMSWYDTLCAPDGARNFVESGKTLPTLPYASGPHKQDFMERFSKDGFDAPVCWYKAMTTNVQSESDRKLIAERGGGYDWKVKVPALFWGGKNDIVCRVEMAQKNLADGLLPEGTKIKTVDAGHWALLAEPETFGKDVLEYLKENFA